MADLSSRFDTPALRIPVRAVRGFFAHRGLVQAASLSYTTLLSLVPLLALVLSISKGVVQNQDPEAFRDMVDRFLSYAIPQLGLLSEQAATDTREDVFARLAQWVDRINAGALGVFGALTLVSVAIMLLSSIEAALNDVWDVEEARPLSRRIIYYWAGVTLIPILLFFSIGLTSSGLVARILGALPGPVVTFFLQFVLPVVLLGTGFTLLYWTMPNTTVPLRAAAAGGVTAGLLFQANNVMSALYLSQVAYYGRIYGSLGAIPVVMVGIYLAWGIVLVGAEVAHAVAMPALKDEPYPQGYTARSRLALEVARVATEKFLSGECGATVPEIAEALAIPTEWAHRTVNHLAREGMLIPSAPSEEDDEFPRYLPSRPPAEIPVLEVLRAVRGRENGGSPASPSVEDAIARLSSAEDSALAGVTLESLARPGAKEPS